jgi:uncharacterized membrane protein YraQ (UPF0718 family)
MNLRDEWKKLLLMIGGVFVLFWLPTGSERFRGAVLESLALAKWYAREHVILCLVPAFFIAGAISVFVSQAAVMKYLGAKASKVLAYGVAAVSGTILAVCSCTVLPLFAGIYKRGAGLGPATVFLYSGPAINVLAVILTARVLGLELGVARAAGAVVFSVVIGLLMALIFRREEQEKAKAATAMPEPEVRRALWKNAVFFASMVGVLVFANWGRPAAKVTTSEAVRGKTVFLGTVVAETEGLLKIRLEKPLADTGERVVELRRSMIVRIKHADPAWGAIYSAKWYVATAFSVALAAALVAWFGVKWWHAVLAAAPVTVLSLLPLVIDALDFPLYVMVPFAAGVLGLSVVAKTSNDETQEWLDSTWGFAKQILPLLVSGVLVAGLLLGAPDGGQGLIPREWVAKSVGGNSLGANLFASVAGALMYFATLTEVPILQGLLNSGMGKGPALALLLAGPALSLPNMLVIRSVMGTRKTLVFVALVVAMATTTGMVFGVVRG